MLLMHGLRLLYLACCRCSCNLLTSESKVDSRKLEMDGNLPPVVVENTRLKSNQDITELY